MIIKGSHILSIESAIGGGSLSLFAGGSEIGQHTGNSGVSRAEDLLPNIDLLLRHHRLEMSAIDEIVVSAGPGSFTGIRIGIATVLGLSNALDIPVRQLSLLQAIAYCRPSVGELTVALPVGRATACFQSFEANADLVIPLNAAATLSTDEFKAMVLDSPKVTFLTSGYLLSAVEAEKPDNVENLGDCLSTYLARAAIETDISDVPEPLFISRHTTG